LPKDVSQQGDQMSLRKNWPTCSPTRFFSEFAHDFIRGETLLKKFGLLLQFKKEQKVNNRPIAENLPNLVTLVFRQENRKAGSDKSKH
jgi:hypothetical protein